MNIGVFGLWHLGCVTAACLAEAGHTVTGLDFDEPTVVGLKDGCAPLFEPGLNELIASGIASKRLTFSGDPVSITGCGLVWVTFDTPVDDDDRADVALVELYIERVFPHLRAGTVVLISSQLPVGTTRRLAQEHARMFPAAPCHFAYSPENLRLGKAIEVFTKAERIVVGSDGPEVRRVLAPVLAAFTDNIVWLSVESAEMVKHAVNAFLATSVIFANEIATVCERVGADAAEVERALRLEPRIGPRAYIRPGASFAGGTLARDVVFLNGLADREQLTLPLLHSLLPSNEAHQHWPVRRASALVGDLSGRTIAVLGLSYKPGTDTLRRSSSIAMCRELHALGAKVRAFDPAVRAIPADLSPVITLVGGVEEALKDADAAIIATEWPEFRVIDPALCRRAMRSVRIIDPNRFLGAAFDGTSGVEYLSVGRR